MYKFSDPCQKQPHLSIVLSFFRIHSVYIYSYICIHSHIVADFSRRLYRITHATHRSSVFLGRKTQDFSKSPAVLFKINFFKTNKQNNSISKKVFLASRNAENARVTPMWGAPRTANTPNDGSFCSIGGHLARVSKSHR